MEWTVVANLTVINHATADESEARQNVVKQTAMSPRGSNGMAEVFVTGVKNDLRRRHASGREGERRDSRLHGFDG